MTAISAGAGFRRLIDFIAAMFNRGLDLEDERCPRPENR
jgi:hypothetical protein